MTPDNSSLYKTSEGHRLAMQLYDTLLAKITVPYDMVQVQTRYGETNVLCAGPADGAPVVFWHGLGLMGPHWWPQINVLSQSYRVYAPDVIGSMGKSAPTRPDSSGPAYGEWMAEVLAGLGLEQAHQVGISNGVWLIIKLAAVAPERITSAVLMSAAGFVRPNWRIAIRLLPGLGPNPFWSKERRVRYFLRIMAPPGQEPSDEAVQLMLIFLHHHKHEMPPQRVADSALRNLTAPVYLMMAEYERSFSPQAVIQRAQAVLPNLVKAAIVPGVAHGMIHEDPEQVNQCLLAWLDSRK